MFDSKELVLKEEEINWELHEQHPVWIDGDKRPVPILIKVVTRGNKPLSKKRPSDIAWDVPCVADEEWERFGLDNPRFYLRPGDNHTFHTGIEVATPERYGFIIRDRSGMGVNNIIHSAGVIEGTYRGEWHIHLINVGKDTYMFEVGDRIAQAVLIPIFPAEISMVDDLPKSDRGTKGFGSSGR